MSHAKSAPGIEIAHARTRVLRVAPLDWPKVKLGVKREFRVATGGYGNITEAETPTLIAAYSPARFQAQPESQLMMLEKVWREPLLAMTPESLAAENFDTMREFKRYWRRQRYPKRGYRPADNITAFRLRPLVDGDLETAGRVLLERLYGQWLL